MHAISTPYLLTYLCAYAYNDKPDLNSVIDYASSRTSLGRGAPFGRVEILRDFSQASKKFCMLPF